MKTKAVKKIGGWPDRDDLYHSEDTGMWAALAARFEGIWVPAKVLEYRENPLSITRTQKWLEADERLDIIEKISREGQTN